MSDYKKFDPSEEDDLISIEFEDGNTYYLPDISYNKFTEYMFKVGTSDTEYTSYLRENKMKELTDFNDSVFDLKLVVESKFGDRKLIFKCVYDSEEEDRNE
jgi:hypothetical protein